MGICVKCGKPATGQCEGLPADIKGLVGWLNEDIACLRRAASNATFVQDGYVRVADPELLCEAMDKAAAALEAQARVIDGLRDALTTILDDAESGQCEADVLAIGRAALVEPVKR
jgi:hypothetical protein